MHIGSAESLAKLQKKLSTKASKVDKRVFVCAGTACIASGALEIFDALQTQAKAKKLDIGFELYTEDKNDSVHECLASKSGCHGFCQMGPLVYIKPLDILYVQVKEKHVPDIIEKTLVHGEIIEELLFIDPNSKQAKQGRKDIPFYASQQRLVLKRCGEIDPEDIYDYIAHEGFMALSKALHESTPKKIIAEIEKSGLRGRGGAGFPTGIKWKICAQSEGSPRTVICNGDEGDPGAFMDRSVMEGDPFQVIEGMIIAGYAVNANHGRIYVRDEYPLALKRINKAIEICRRYGILGNNILGSEFNFDIAITRGGGAFVCGEESALIASVEGRRGMPMPRPPYPATKGLWEGPTVINNVETFSSVSHIIYHGASWFKGFGTKKSPGTKTFSLVGKINNTGLVEVPMGISMKTIVEDIGGGILDNREFKAVQTGGPSGGCIPAHQLTLPVDFDNLIEKGSMMGSGGMIIMDDRTCMVDVARYYTNFLIEESCGKCVPCREGLVQTLSLLNDICEGRGTLEHIEKIKELAKGIALGSLCALGKTAPNPVLSTLQHFEDEYLAHVENHECPAGVCKELITYKVAEQDCTFCGVCKRVCAFDAVEGEKKQVHKIIESKCTRCGSCFVACKFNAIEVLPGRPPKKNAIGKRLKVLKEV